MSESPVRLSVGTQTFEFADTPQAFGACRVTELFGRKNNKTVGETICHLKYLKLAS